MKKGLLSVAALLATVVGTAALTSCGPKKPDSWKVDNTGKVINIRAWNDEFKRFFEKYVSDEKVDSKTPAGEPNPSAPKTYHLDGLPVNWSIVPSENAQYQDSLDQQLLLQADAAPEDKIDMILAEADYILKYAGSDTTQDVKALGVTDMSNTYNYTVQAASDANGNVKGVSFQCCPSALIYNRVVARDVLGTDDPVEVQKHVSSWAKFDETAAKMKAKNYFMTASVDDSYRVFSNNATTPWVNEKGEVAIPQSSKDWMEQAKKYAKNGYTEICGVWDAAKNANIAADANKAFCCFGPAWYYNFCMGNSKAGDWAICEGPQAHFWGGTWLLAAAGSDNTDAVAKIMNAFINDQQVCENLIKNEGQFTNNQKANAKVAAEYDRDGKGNTFLGGQNDTKLYLELAKNIKFLNPTNYDQICNESLQQYYREFLNGDVTEEKAIENFYKSLKTKYEELIVPVK